MNNIWWNFFWSVVALSIVVFFIIYILLNI